MEDAARAAPAGASHHRVSPTASRPCPIASAACPSSTSAQCPDGCRACIDACPTGRARERRGRDRSSTSAGACSARTAWRPARRARSEFSQRLPARHARARGSGVARGRAAAGRRARRRDASPLRPLAQAAPGQRRRLQRLRGGRQRARRRSSSTSAASASSSSRRRATPTDCSITGAGQPEHAARAARRPTTPCPDRSS